MASISRSLAAGWDGSGGGGRGVGAHQWRGVEVRHTCFRNGRCVGVRMCVCVCLSVPLLKPLLKPHTKHAPHSPTHRHMPCNCTHVLPSSPNSVDVRARPHTHKPRITSTSLLCPPHTPIRPSPRLWSRLVHWFILRTQDNRGFLLHGRAEVRVGKLFPFLAK